MGQNLLFDGGKSLDYISSFAICTRALKSTSPVAWRDVNLIGNFDFTTSSTAVDIEALAARYQNEDFWRRSMTEGDDDNPQE
jgi:hypothetical protein